MEYNRVFIHVVLLGLFVLRPASLWADQFDPRLEALFHTLAQGTPQLYPDPDPAERAGRLEHHAAIAEKIIDIWTESGNPAFDLLGERVEQALNGAAGATAHDLAHYMVEISPTHVHGWFLLGVVNHRLAQGRDDAHLVAALKAYDQAIRLEPRHFLALARAGDVAVTLGQDDKALSYYNQAKVFYPEVPGVEAALLEVSKRRQAAEI